MYHFASSPDDHVRQYIQLALVPLIDRSTDEGDALWHDLIGHHCFTGNDSMMVFERFFGHHATLAEITARQGPDARPTIERFCTQWLEDNGYQYTEDRFLTHKETGGRFHGLLLDISW